MLFVTYSLRESRVKGRGRYSSDDVDARYLEVNQVFHEGKRHAKINEVNNESEMRCRRTGEVRVIGTVACECKLCMGIVLVKQ